MTSSSRPPADPVHFVLVPGFWLGGWAWDAVAEPLRNVGHRVTAVTLPGLDSPDVDRRDITLRTQIDALGALVERYEEVVLVAHSGAGSVAYGVSDRMPERLRRLVYVDSGPPLDGHPLDDSVPPVAVEVPLPEWSEIEENDGGPAGTILEGLTIDHLALFRRRAVPEPAGVAREPIRLHNEARRDVPSTLVACSFRSDQVREFAAEGHPMFAELATLTNLAFVDLPTGHWPMFSKPEELAEALLSTIA